jgi:hypothetical protein
MRSPARILKTVAIILSAAVLAITALLLVIYLKHNLSRPERCVTGAIHGRLWTLWQTEFSFITFDQNYREIRKEPVDRYLLRYFTIGVNTEEVYIHIFNSRFSPGTSTRLYENVWLWPNQNLQRINASGNTKMPNLFITKSVAVKKPIHRSSHSPRNLVFSWEKKRHVDAYRGTVQRAAGSGGKLVFITPKRRTSASLSEILDSNICSFDTLSPGAVDTLCHYTTEGFELADGLYRIKILAYKYNSENKKMEQMTVNNSEHPFEFRISSD